MTEGPPSASLAPVHGIRLLLVEDDPGDELILAAEFADAKLVTDSRVVRTVTHACVLLAADAPTWLPDVVLVDVDLRNVGLVALSELTRHAARAGAWTVVMTGAEIERRILQDWSAPADLYVRKPVDLRAMLEIVRGIQDLGLLVMRTPPAVPEA